jgi:phytoene dehydrogenase-like protein
VHLGTERDFVLFGQYSMADPTRSPPGRETAWAYSHVLGETEIEEQVERHAPGFRRLVRGRRVERLAPGRVNLGTARWRNELVLRPFWGRPATGIPNVWLTSASAHPGGAVHGAAGWIASQAALRSASRRWAARG